MLSRGAKEATYGDSEALVTIQSFFASNKSENRKKDEAARILLRGKRGIQEPAPEDAMRYVINIFFHFQRRANSN